MGQPAARLGDMHVCPMVTPGTPPIPHVGGPILPPCSTNVFTGGLPQARVGDMCVCVGPTDVVVKGSSGVFVNDMPAARIGDMTAHGGQIVVGLPTVLIGEQRGGSAGEGGGGGGASIDDFMGGGAPLLEFTLGSAQAHTLTAAAKSGVPFCEVCFGKGGG